MFTYYYSVNESDQRFPLNSWSELEDYPDTIAEEAAEDYFHDHDGWEDSWPLDIVLYQNENSEEFIRLNVDMESQPHFYCVD